MDENVLLLYEQEELFQWILFWNDIHFCIKAASCRPYLSLDHLHALMPQFIDGPCNVHFVFFLDLFKNDINTYECASSPHSSTVCMYVHKS